MSVNGRATAASRRQLLVGLRRRALTVYVVGVGVGFVVLWALYYAHRATGGAEMREWPFSWSGSHDDFGRDIVVPPGMRPIEPEYLSVPFDRPLPPEYIRPGVTVFDTSIGHYRVVGRVRVGGSGVLYLSVTEAVRGMPLSESRVREESEQRVRHATMRPSVVLYDREVMIGEGDPAYPYPGRIELWFKPDGSRPAVRLFEGLYWIRGWEF